YFLLSSNSVLESTFLPTTSISLLRANQEKESLASLIYGASAKILPRRHSRHHRGSTFDAHQPSTTRCQLRHHQHCYTTMPPLYSR
ncbi:hypothetical protein U1Q18_014590, partial [Sarracenia purpurea var. burkii]